MEQKTDALLRELETEFSDLPNVPRETGKFLYILVSTIKPKNILEIGTCIGYSTIWLGAASKRYGGKVTTIEIDKNNAKIASVNFKKANLDNIGLINGDALQEIPKLNGNNGKFDFLFLDAIKSDYIKYFRLAENKLNDNALVVADNAIIFKDRMKDYLDYVRKKYFSVIMPIGTGVEMTLKN